MDPRKPDGAPWGVSDCVRMHAWFRTEAQRQLRQRDHDLYGIPLSGQVTQPVKDGTMTRWVVNPERSKHRSTSADRNALQEKLWTEFCAEPRDPDCELRKVGLVHQEDVLPPQARAMQSALAPIIEQNRVLIEQNAQLLAALRANSNGQAPATEPTPMGKRQTRLPQSADAE
ncbi:MAG: hypothetical protein Q7R41_15785 [Phycisphaerales bacterium]|nr:hypothetical protein [Phycisphaerales bacterium]